MWRIGERRRCHRQHGYDQKFAVPAEALEHIAQLAVFDRREILDKTPDEAHAGSAVSPIQIADLGRKIVAGVLLRQHGRRAGGPLGQQAFQRSQRLLYSGVACLLPELAVGGYRVDSHIAVGGL